MNLKIFRKRNSFVLLSTKSSFMFSSFTIYASYVLYEFFCWHSLVSILNILMLLKFVLVLNKYIPTSMIK